MSGSSASMTVFFVLPSILGGILLAALTYALARRPSRPLAFFVGFYLISLLQLAGVPLVSFVGRATGSLDLRFFWKISPAIGRLRYVFLILFAHSIHQYRATPALTVLMIALVAAGIATPFFFYSLVPYLVDIAVALYCFGYWLTLYLLRDRLALSARRLELLRAILLCSGFFLTGLLLDLLERIPQAGVYVSILIIDFYPIYLVCVGAAMAYWALRDLRSPAGSSASVGSSTRPEKLESPNPESDRAFDLGAIPVTEREREVIALALSGETNGAIAERLFISESTVKKHLNNAFRKLGIGSRWELLKLMKGIEPKE